MRSELGKIQKISMGYGGYQDAQIGFNFTLGGEGWSVCDFWGHWAHKPDGDCYKWTHEQQIESLGKTFWRMKELMNDAKVNSLMDLEGTPIRAHFDGNLLKKWEVLKEVI